MLLLVWITDRLANRCVFANTCSTDAKTKMETLTGLRDGLESWCQGSTYPIFLQKFVPIWLNILSAPPVFISTSPEQKIRNCVLEIVHRLPMNPVDATEPHCAAIVDKCLELIRTENEDNAVICLKIIMDFERAHVRALGGRAQKFLDLILELFDSMQQTVHDTFDSAQAKDGSSQDAAFANSPRPGSPVATTTTVIGADPGTEPQTTRQLVKGMQSFKESKIVMDNIDGLYGYLKGRSDGAIKTAKVTEIK